MTKPITFQISDAETRLFARASGDFNPLHVDPVAARRTQFGHTLIHGVFGTLRAIDQWLGTLSETQRNPIALQELRVKYRQPITQGQTVRLKTSESDTGVRLEIIANESRSQIIDLTFTERESSDSALIFSAPSGASELKSKRLAIEDCEHLEGVSPLRWDEDALNALFPNALELLPRNQIVALLASTEVVGMQCPGLHSVFAQLTLDFNKKPNSNLHENMHFKVTSADSRINRVEIDIETSAAEGRIEAFFRSPPAEQASFKTALKSVPSGVFQKQKAIVIGASRGLGEVITKVLAAGGAEIVMTYASGRSDAEAIAREIGESTTAPHVGQYDIVAGTLDDSLRQCMQEATHIYYLASPKIEKGDASNWNEELFQTYRRFYLKGFERVIASALESQTRSELLHCFVPSSVFLENTTKGFAEYIAAKKEAEEYARSLAGQKKIAVALPRLPRLLTDQTSGVRGLSAEETLQVISSVLTEVFAH